MSLDLGQARCNPDRLPRMYALRALVLVLAALAAPWAAAQAEKPQRVALVIGNGKYAGAPLPNAVHDGADVAKELAAAGFTVIHRENASLKEMVLALREFGDKIGRTSTGVFYYAGHGLQVRGRNYLVPTDADIAREDEVAFAALDLAAVMEKLDSARNPVNLVILDACRNNPFANRFTLAAQGLAQVEAPPGTLIAFSTSPGSVAADGTGRNGLYTRHLLEQMRRAGAPIEETFKMVRAAVRKDSAGRQVPWESTSLEAAFSFHAARAPAPAKVAAVAPGNAPAASVPRTLASATSPPSFVPGDTWTYRVLNRLDQSERPITMTVKGVQDNEVTWLAEQKSDLLGNFTRIKRGEGWRTYKPASQMYAFPLNPGASSAIRVEETDGQRFWENEIRIDVGQEEEVSLPAGRFRAVKLQREVRWSQRDRPQNHGVSRWTYWYNGEAKRWVAAEQINVTAAGKTILSERWELESYSVR
jgi:uncharacterized caspase-like protein